MRGDTIRARSGAENFARWLVPHRSILPPHRFVHTSWFFGFTCSEDFILLELSCIAGRPKEARLAMPEQLKERMVAATDISPTSSPTL
jgi:hypothetical protein